MQVTANSIYAQLKCVACHGENATGGQTAPALAGNASRIKSPNAMAAAMWSHVTGMWKAMDQAGIHRPQLTAENAADLYAYFSNSAGADSPENAAEGRQVYEAKICATCHGDRVTGAPDLTPMAVKVSPFSMVASVWQHGAGMLSQMVAREKPWQTPSLDEVGHLIATGPFRARTGEACGARRICETDVARKPSLCWLRLGLNEAISL